MDATELDLSIARAFFERNASLKDGSNAFMSEDDFINTLRPSNVPNDKISREQYRILFKIANRDRVGGSDRLTYRDWLDFNNLLANPDAEYRIIYRLFDPADTGRVTFANFKRILEQNKSKESIDINWDDTWANLYLGKSSSRHPMNYNQFSQMLRGVLGERTRQAFLQQDKDKDGYITISQFANIIRSMHSHLLSDHILNNLEQLFPESEFQRISYASLRAFENILRELDLVSQIVLSATERKADRRITKQDFMDEAARVTRFCRFTPLEIDVLFRLAGSINGTEKVGIENFAQVLDPSWESVPSGGIFRPDDISSKKSRVRGMFESLIESAYHFGLGAVAGGLGATAVYPIDLVKTRMQNQRSKVVGEVMYRNSLDCAKKVIKNEGVMGLYSGLLPQLLGVAPEKAIKLTVNDYIRKKGRQEDGTLPVKWEILAGACAGGCQVIVTNPLEVVKIQLQVRGQVAEKIISQAASAPKVSAWNIVKSLGLFGLYKGASACLMRDIPFSAIYFPAYAHLKSDLFGETAMKKCTVVELLIAGAIAGMPAAYFTTPADVVKTRLQVKARKGQTNYNNIRHAFKTIYHEEGFRAFFKGGLARVLRSSPQFGVTLASYEVLQSLFPLKKSEPEQARRKLSEKQRDVSYLRSRNALKILLDLDSNFGNYKPAFATGGAKK